MAAIRSALALLGRRSCGPSRSAAVASLGGTRLEMQQVFRPAAPPLSSLLPARHSVESYRRLSTGGGRVPADKAENLWQRCMYRIKNADLEQKTKFYFWYSMVVLVGSSAFYMLKTRKLIRHM